VARRHDHPPTERLGLLCPVDGCTACGGEALETRKTKTGVTRRRTCANGHRFTTYEVVVKQKLSNER
jgi:transcriptional regulator NrdR family protein